MGQTPAPVTIRDLARSSGLSIATISLALRNNARISEKTRREVKELAERMGYRSNPLMASYWATMRAKGPASFQGGIALINDWETAPSVATQPWLSPTYQAMTQRASELGYLVEEFSIASPDPALRAQKLAATLRVLRARNILGIATIFNAHAGTFIDAMQSLADFAIVFIGAEYGHIERSMQGHQHLPFHRANPDYYGNMRTLLEALIHQGYRRPGFWPNTWDEARLAGESTAAFNFWIQGLPREGRIPVLWPQWQVDPPLSVVRSKFVQWFKRTKPDVVICQNFEVHQWLLDLGLRIPRDVGLAHTYLGPPELDWSGMDCRMPAIASAGIDLLTAHLHRNERGTPDVPKDVKIVGEWKAGKTTRHQSTQRR